jgi:FKBP-type peptidyl-prolyl cis-trans isomerase
MRAIFYLLTFVFFLISCGKKQEQPTPVSEAQTQEEFIKANQELVKQEAEQIEEFIFRHGFKMQKTGTGLHYEIYKEGNENKPFANDLVTIDYKCFLIDGTLLYEADSAKPLTFVLGKAQQPRGLEEALMMMGEGGKAKLVVPSHLAYGLIGDDNKIQGAASLYYDVELLTIEHATK